jgi:hypothetical protein
LIGAVAVLLVAVVILASKTLSNHPVANVESAEFTARKTTSNDLPNSVVFNYNIDQLTGDSFFIQQSWDKNRRVRIQKKNYTLTDIYYEPGYHKAKLIVNDQVVKTVGVSIPTNGWFLYAIKYEKGSLPVYIRKEKVATDGMMRLTKEELLAHQVNIAAEQRYCYTFFPGKFIVPSDNFIYTGKLHLLQKHPAWLHQQYRCAVR